MRLLFPARSLRVEQFHQDLNALIALDLVYRNCLRDYFGVREALASAFKLAEELVESR